MNREMACLCFVQHGRHYGVLVDPLLSIGINNGGKARLLVFTVLCVSFVSISVLIFVLSCCRIEVSEFSRLS